MTSVHDTRSRLAGKRSRQSSSSLSACHNFSPSHTAPKLRERSNRNPVELDCERTCGLRVIEQFSLPRRARAPTNTARQTFRPRPPLGIKFPQLRYGLLHNLAAASDRTYQPPVNMALAVFAPCRVSQVHTPTFSQSVKSGQDTWSALHAGFTSSRPKLTTSQNHHSTLQPLTADNSRSTWRDFS